MIDVKNQLKSKKTMIIAIGLIGVLFFGFNAITGKKPIQQVEASSNAVTVKVQEVKRMDSLSDLTYKANLEPAEVATVSCNGSGQVTQVLFDNGDKVVQGQVLAYLDDKDLQNRLRTAELDLSKLKLDLSSKQNRYNRAKTLYENGACAQTDFEDAELNYKSTLNDVELKNVDIQNINNSINNSVIKAAISGGIVDKSVSVGQYMNPGSTLANIKNNASIKAVIQLSQSDLSKVAVGQSVTLKLSEKDEKAYQGVVETIAASANSQTRVFDCLIKIDNTSGSLNSGVSGYIQIPNNDKKQVLAIPTSAISGSEGNYSLFTIKKNEAHKISVTIGEMSDDMVEITSGVQEGDKIIVTNSNSLQDGDQVEISGEGK